MEVESSIFAANMEKGKTDTKKVALVTGITGQVRNFEKDLPSICKTPGISKRGAGVVSESPVSTCRETSNLRFLLLRHF